MENNHASHAGKQHADLTVGACLVAGSALVVLGMAHHPTSAHGGGVGDYVHGAMMIFLTLLFTGFSYFALRRGVQRPVILAGLVAYGVSLMAHFGAATINGFIVTALAARESVSHDIFILCWETNQALATLGVFATGAAFILWSLDFIGRSGSVNRFIGAAGLATGIVPAFLLSGGIVDMNVAGAFLIYAIHAAWSALVGVRFIQQKI